MDKIATTFSPTVKVIHLWFKNYIFVFAEIKGLVLRVLIFIMVYFSPLVVLLSQGRAMIDSLVIAVASEKIDTNRYHLYTKIVSELEYVDRLEAIPYAKEMLKLALSIDDLKKIARSNQIVGSNFLFLGNTDSASTYLINANEQFEALDDPWSLNENINNLALLYQRTNRYEDAVIQYQKVITNSQELEDYVGEYLALANLMSLYMDLDDNDEALKYLFDIEELVSKVETIDKETASILQSYNSGVFLNAGQCYLDRYTPDIPNYDHLNTALNYLNRADSSLSFLESEFAIKYYSGYINHTQGDVFYKQHEIDSTSEYDYLQQALLYYTSSNQLFNEIQEERGICFSLNSLGKVYIDYKEFQKANVIVNQAMETAQRIDFKEEIRDSYKHLSRINEELGNYKIANQFLKKWVNLKEKISNAERTKFTKFAEVKYETQQKEKELADLAFQNQIEHQRQRVQQFIFGGILLLFGFIGYIFFSRFRYRKQKEKAEFEHRVNQAMSRFVPMDFICAIGKEKITEVELGDQREKEVTVLFTDIRSFTSISEGMTPRENFAFVKEYAERMGPIITRNGGFISQYLGDGIMAIFQENPTDALTACIEMQQDIDEFNEILEDRGQIPINVGMGMHTGPLIMGIIGDDTRRDATLISDTVNTAARIESTTKLIGANILLSEQCMQNIKEPKLFDIEEKGEVLVKGKNIPIRIYECSKTFKNI